MKKKIIVKSSVVAVLVLLVAIIFAINKREDLFPMFNYTTEHSITTLADEDKLDENLPTVVFFHTKKHTKIDVFFWYLGKNGNAL